MSSTSTSTRTIAFILSLIGGLIVVVGSAIEVLLLSFGSYSGTYYGMGPGMMRGYGFCDYGSSMMAGLSLLSLVFGIILIVEAIMYNSRPDQRITWGIKSWLLYLLET